MQAMQCRLEHTGIRLSVHPIGTSAAPATLSASLPVDSHVQLPGVGGSKWANVRGCYALHVQDTNRSTAHHPAPAKTSSRTQPTHLPSRGKHCKGTARIDAGGQLDVLAHRRRWRHPSAFGCDGPLVRLPGDEHLSVGPAAHADLAQWRWAAG